MKTTSIEVNSKALTSEQQQQVINLNEQLSAFDIGDSVYVYIPDSYPCWKDAMILDFEPEINSFKILYIDTDAAHDFDDRDNFRLNIDKIEPIVTIVQANNISKDFGEVIVKADNDKLHLSDNYKCYTIETDELIKIFGSMSNCLEHYVNCLDS